MENYLKAVGENIRMQRTRQKLSRRALGDKVNLSAQSIWNIETGRTNPKLMTLQKLAQALDMDIAFIVSPNANLLWVMSDDIKTYVNRIVQRQLDKGELYDDDEWRTEDGRHDPT